MENPKPLVSDEDIDGHILVPDKWAPSGHRLTFRPITTRAVREIYEKDRAEKDKTIADLREALEEVMTWINNWDPHFVNDDEWDDTKAKVDKALLSTLPKPQL